MSLMPIIERAYELARSGDCASFSDIKRKLAREGYHDAQSHLDGMLIRAQLTALLEANPPSAVPRTGISGKTSP